MTFGRLYTLSLLTLLALVAGGCSDDSSTGTDPQPETYTLLASHCDPLVITVGANQTVTITTTDSVLTHVNGGIADCDFWTDADGIPDCHYVTDVTELHSLPFMALIGYFNGEWFVVGTSFERTFDTAGDLELKVNDWGPCGTDSDNVGQFVITVLVE